MRQTQNRTAMKSTIPIATLRAMPTLTSVDNPPPVEELPSIFDDSRLVVCTVWAEEDVVITAKEVERIVDVSRTSEHRETLVVQTLRELVEILGID